MDRRDLLWGSFAFLGVLPLCCTTPEIGKESVRYDGNTVVVDLGKASCLRPAGSAGAVVDQVRKLDIIIAHTGGNRFFALDRHCTHGGAHCTYNHKRHTLQCTSLNHAEYDLEGTLLHGRTHGNLRAYAVRRSGDALRIELKEGS